MGLSILIMAAGLGRRFAGHPYPKPLIDVGGKVMIHRVLDNVVGRIPHTVTVVCLKYFRSALENSLGRDGVPRVDAIIDIDSPLSGAALSALYGSRHLYRHDDDLMIANCDQIIDFDIDDFVVSARNAHRQGSIALFEADGDPKWSYSDYDKGRVIRTVEKQPISKWATCGIYWFCNVHTFRFAVNRMIEKDIRTNGEYYLAPCFNELEDVGGYIVDGMVGIGTPEDLSSYLSKESAGLIS